MWKPLTAAALAAVTLAGAPQQAEAVILCKMTVKTKYVGPDGHWLTASGYKSRVKTKGGTWRMMAKGGWHPGNATAEKKASDTYRAALGCTFKRRFKIVYYCYDGHSSKQRTAYYPSKTGWHKGSRVTIPLNC